MLKSFFRRKPIVQARPTLPPGERIYAIGDVHGRLDCLDHLIADIDADIAARGPATTTLVFLGDLVDRGPESRGVVDRCMMLDRERTCVFLMGNHEEITLAAWEGDAQVMRLFHRVGGRETLISYGISPDDYDRTDIAELTMLIGEHIPLAHTAFMRRMRDSYNCGDYLFVHAGVRPGVALDNQTTADLRWIRREFLEDTRDHGKVVVHGHTVTPHVEQRPNRIGIDTGAWASGRLTALGLEGEAQWFLSSAD